MIEKLGDKLKQQVDISEIAKKELSSNIESETFNGGGNNNAASTGEGSVFRFDSNSNILSESNTDESNSFKLSKDVITDILKNPINKSSDENLDKGQTIYLTIGDSNDNNIMMTVKNVDDSNNQYEFNNVMVSNGKDKYEVFLQIESSVDDITLDFIENLVDVESFEVLQVIKTIQLLKNMKII